MKKVLLVGALILGLALTSCKNSTRERLKNNLGVNSGFLIEMINCDGTVGRTYKSTGKVQSESTSDGYYFEDQVTDELVEITGRLIITPL